MMFPVRGHDSRAIREHDDHIRVDGGDLREQIELQLWQIHVLAVPALRLIRGRQPEEHEDDLCSLGCLHCLGDKLGIRRLGFDLEARGEEQLAPTVELDAQRVECVLEPGRVDL